MNRFNYSLNTAKIPLCGRNAKFHAGDRLELMNKIENVIFNVIEQIAKSEAPSFVVYNHKKEGIINFSRTSSRPKFAVIIYLLDKIFKLLLTDKFSTKREIYYENVSQFQSQHEIDRALYDICQVLSVPIWQLRIQGTAKGLVAGSVTFHMKDGEEVTADITGGTLVPQNVIDIVHITSSAKWILIVEKDAAFQKLLQENTFDQLGPCIFITGKGFPDVNTRMLVCRLWSELDLPILALVDADPHGIDIMCVYKYGSLAMASHSSGLACPAVRWLGVHPTDIERLGIDNQPLTSDDSAKLKNMLERSYVKSNSALQKEIQALLTVGLKAEIEGLSKFGSSYLCDNYIVSKITYQEYI